MRCIGINKPYYKFRRCRNLCDLLLCKEHYSQPLKLLLWLAGIFITLYTLLNIFSADNTATKEDIVDLKKTFEQRFNEFSVPELNSETEYMGASIALVLALHPQEQLRRKYIFDIAESENQNRISLFLDANNNLVFELVDRIGETYNMRMPPSSYKFDEFIMLYCEYGITEEFSFLRVFKNNKILEQSKFNFRIELPREVEKRYTLMADLNGKNNTAMTVSFYSVLKGTLGKTKRRGLFNTIKWYLESVNPVFKELEN